MRLGQRERVPSHRCGQRQVGGVGVWVADELAEAAVRRVVELAQLLKDPAGAEVREALAEHVALTRLERRRVRTLGEL